MNPYPIIVCFFLCLPSLGVPHQASPVYLLFGTLGLVSLLFILHCLIVLSDQYAVLTYEYEDGFSFYAETYKVHFPSVDLNGLVTIEGFHYPAPREIPVNDSFFLLHY